MSDRQEPLRRRASLGARLLLGALLVGVAVLWSHNVVVRSPYPQHIDERYVNEAAFRIARTGDLNPHFFHYGTLPIYIAALCQRAAMTVVAWTDGPRLFDRIDAVTVPYYREPCVSLAPRWACLLAGLVALACVVRSARQLGAGRFTAILPALVLTVYPAWSTQVFTYVNVDILAVALSAGALAFIASTSARTDLTARALLPALFCGALAATKYNAALIGLPFLVANLWAPPGRRILSSAVLMVATAVVFAALEFAALRDFASLRADVLHELRHYRNGHAGHEGEPGLEQLAFYLAGLRDGVGLVPALAGAVGVVNALRVDRRRTLIVLSFPVLSLLLLCAQRVRFERNALPAWTALAPFVALGVRDAADALGRVAERLGPRSASARAVGHALPGLALIAALVGSELARDMPALRPLSGDSRDLARAWLDARAGAGCVLWFPEQLELAPSSLPPACTPRRFDIRSPEALDTLVAALAARSAGEAYLLLPEWGFRASRPGDRALRRRWRGAPERLQLGAPVWTSPGASVPVNLPHVYGSPAVSIYAL